MNVRIPELFFRFKAHYGFEVTFANPYTGHEKQYRELGRLLVVQLLRAAAGHHGYAGISRGATRRCEAYWQREHYKKSFPILLRFKDDKNLLIYLQRYRFGACRYVRVMTDGYGKFSIDGKHFYSSSSDWAGGVK